MDRALLTRIGCRYTCCFCHPPRPYEYPAYSHATNLEKLTAEIVSAPADCAGFVIGGADCVEDLELVFELCREIRRRRGDTPRIVLQSHCAELRKPEVVERVIAHGIERIRLPVYGPSAAIHHRLMTPKPGVAIDGFPQLEAIDAALASRKVAVTAHTVIAEGNVGHLTDTIDALAALAEKHRTPIDYWIRPVLLTPDQGDGYLPMASLASTLRRAHAYLTEINRAAAILDYRFEGFPFCLFERVDPRIRNADFSDELKRRYTLFVGEQRPVAEWLYSRLDPRIPSYKIRVHDPMCESCLMQRYCAGFQQIDYETYGVGGLEPIR